MKYPYSKILKESNKELNGLLYGYPYKPLGAVSVGEKDCEDLNKDTTNLNIWNLANPYCIAMDKWEELKYLVCNDLKIVPIITTEGCDIVYSIIKKDLSCSLMYNISVYKNLCFTGMKVTVDTKLMQSSYKILTDKFKHFGDIEKYRHLLETCNMSPQIIHHIYSEGASTDGQYIITKDARYKISDIQFTEKINPTTFKYLDQQITKIDTTNYVK